MPAFAFAILLFGCVPTPDGDPGVDPDDCPVVTWDEPVTTQVETLVSDPPLSWPLDLTPGLPEGLAIAVDLGLGGYGVDEPDVRILRDELMPGSPGGSGPDRRSVFMMLHETDAQIADTESPTRMVGADNRTALTAAVRPQELYAIHGLDALIRSANALSAHAPIDFALTTGDNADSTQGNEVRWFNAVWDGIPIHPDSGDPDSQVDADCNDPLAPFEPVGADFPWYAVPGNHDVLVQGNFLPGLWDETALKSDAAMGTRDWSLPGGPIAFTTPPDPERALVDRSELAALHLDSPAIPGPVGHGFTADNVSTGTLDWVAHPVPGVALVAVDVTPDGRGSPVLRASTRDDFLLPALEDAANAGEVVVLTSHYALIGCAVEDGGTLDELVAGYPQVVLSIAGHYHENRIRSSGTFWEIQTAATIDWPGQGRLIELVDNGDQTASILTTLFDPVAPEGSMAARHRTLSLIDAQSGWVSGDDRVGEPKDRNTELLIALPDSWSGGVGTAGVRTEDLP